MNQVIISGNLTDDVTLSQVKGDHVVAKFTLAVTKKQEEETRTMYVSMSAWNKTAQNIEKICRKGSHVLCVGELEINRVDDGKGNKKVYPQVVVREFFASGNAINISSAVENKSNSAENQKQSTAIENTEDDVPF